MQFVYKIQKALECCCTEERLEMLLNKEKKNIKKKHFFPSFSCNIFTSEIQQIH